MPSRNLVLLALIVGILNVCSVSHAQTILPADKAIHCILGEARDQGLEGLTAVAEALRNRGTFKGVYGCNAKFTEPKWVWDLGRKAWEASEHSNLTDKADHWHNVVREGETYWTVKMIKTVCIKSHCFYK